MKAVLVQGMSYGDESKGATVDSICRKFPVEQIVRFNGGPQTAHNVITPEGAHHTFSQFGSGTIANPDIKTHLSRFMLMEPQALLRESEALEKLTPDPLARMSVDPKALIITPYHVWVNRYVEYRRKLSKHGSCGRGIGIAREHHLKHGDDNSLLMEDLASRYTLFRKLERIKELLHYEHPKVENVTLPYRYAEDLVWFHNSVKVRPLVPSDYMVFEGAQGVLLDEREEFLPHNTWTNCTFENADTLLDEVGYTDRTRIGCFRSYFTRHGYGPFPTEDPSLLSSLPEPHNGTGKYQGKFRVGKFDFELAKKALDIVSGVDFLSISHLDMFPEGIAVGQNISHRLGVPVGIWAYGPTANNRGFNCNLFDKLSVMEYSKT